MNQTRLMMGMPISVEVVDAEVSTSAFDRVFDYFRYVDETFSTYKDSSEIMRINRGELTIENASADVQLIFKLAEQTRIETDGYFDIVHDDHIDPSGIVKGWAVFEAAELLRGMGYHHYFVDAGGDIQTRGKNSQGKDWRVGVRNPFNPQQIVKSLIVPDCGVATSGTYLRGDHIYNPKGDHQLQTEVVSLTVIGPNVYEADRFATAAFAMGKQGIHFIEELDDFEGYMIDRNGKATLTSGLSQYLPSPVNH
ncbi:MAG: FAD:protein FMN transferase [Anaerolineae bacterium]